MLTTKDEPAPVAAPRVPNAMSESASREVPSDASPTRLKRMLRVDWLGQTAASICWIGSVLAYGIGSSGDWLQLCAASSWLVANIAAAVTTKTDGDDRRTNVGER